MNNKKRECFLGYCNQFPVRWCCNDMVIISKNYVCCLQFYARDNMVEVTCFIAISST